MSRAQYHIFPEAIYKHQINANMLVSDSSDINIVGMGDSKEDALTWALRDLKNLEQELPELIKIVEKI